MDTTVAELKNMIFDERGYRPETQTLTWAGRLLNDKSTLRESSLQEGTTITLSLKVQEEK